MKKISTIILLLLLVSSCKLIDQKEDAEEATGVVTSSKDSSVVNDKDENGCLASAGYVWSKLNKECIKGFTGMQLTPFDNPNNEDETKSAYILFSEDLNQAEVFLPNATMSIILTRKNEGGSWIYNDWQLIPWKGYVLKKADKNMFSGDGQIGKKVMGSDTEQ